MIPINSGLIDALAIRDFRGSLTTNMEKCILITTRTFSKVVKGELTSPEKQQIDLVVGKDFTGIIAEYSISVKAVKICEVDERFPKKDLSRREGALCQFKLWTCSAALAA